MQSTTVINNQFVSGLYAEEIAQFNETIAQSSDRIAHLEQMLNEEREMLKRLQEQQQRHLTAKGAAESAFTQVVNAFQLADAINPDGRLADELASKILEARQAMKEERLAIAASIDLDADAYPEIIQDDPSPNGNGNGAPVSPEPSVLVQEGENASDDLIVPVEASEGEKGITASYHRLMALSISQLRSLASAHDVRGGRSKSAIARKLVGKVTQEELSLKD